MASVVSRDRRQSRYEIYDEVRDAQRFPGATAEQRFGDALVTKHTGQTIDAIVTAGPEALHVSIVFQTRAGSEVPVIYGGVQAATQSQYSGVAGLYGVFSSFDLRGTFDLARELQPQAKRAVFFTGSAVFDERWEFIAEDMISDVRDMEVIFVSGLSRQEVRDRAAAHAQWRPASAVGVRPRVRVRVAGGVARQSLQALRDLQGAGHGARSFEKPEHRGAARRRAALCQHHQRGGPCRACPSSAMSGELFGMFPVHIVDNDDRASLALRRRVLSAGFDARTHSDPETFLAASVRRCQVAQSPTCISRS